MMTAKTSSKKRNKVSQNNKNDSLKQKVRHINQDDQEFMAQELNIKVKGYREKVVLQSLTFF